VRVVTVRQQGERADLSPRVYLGQYDETQGERSLSRQSSVSSPAWWIEGSGFKPKTSTFLGQDTCFYAMTKLFRIATFDMPPRAAHPKAPMKKCEILHSRIVSNSSGISNAISTLNRTQLE
jgi:hypothetical protein